MTISKTWINEALNIHLEGRLDASTASLLEEALISAFNEAKKIEIDFSGLAYVSSAGLRVLLLCHKVAKEKAVYMMIKGVSEDIMDVFEITGFSAILNIE